MKYTSLFLALCAFFFGLTACSPSYQGNLVDARNYLNLNADGKSPAQQYSAYYAMKSNLPAGIAMKKAKFVLLSNQSSQLANYSSFEVKAKGKYLPKQNLLKVKQLWVKTAKGWEHVPIH
jgi:hypothetical protein